METIMSMQAQKKSITTTEILRKKTKKKLQC